MRQKIGIIFLVIIFVAGFGAFYSPFFLKGKLPIPADTIVGLYHPWRDFYAASFPSGIPFRNFIITDPVRQQYPWRELAVNLLKKGQWPVWNPYSFSGTPLLGNLQTAPFYPLNIIFWLMPFNLGWSLLVLLQTVLGFTFMALYLKNLRLKPEAVVLGSVTWAGSGFFIAWLEANNLAQTAIWLPLLLLFTDKIFFTRKKIRWLLLFVLALSSAFLAGHLQTFFYISLVTGTYLLARLWQTKNKRVLLYFLPGLFLFLILTLPQSLPLVRFIAWSARSVDQAAWSRPEWFIPPQNLAQFLAPDFFGNPATLNYFGVFSYQEFVGYVGITGLFFSLLAIWRRDKKTLFFGILALSALTFALPTPWGKLPFVLNLPLISSSQPTRLLVVVDFALAVLSAFGLDFFLRQKSGVFKTLFTALTILGLGLAALWLYVLTRHSENILVSQRNLIFPSLTFLALSFLIVLSAKVRPAIFVLLALAVFDLWRFGSKYTSFSNPEYLYPETSVTHFLQQNTGKDFSRFMTTDDRIFPPNFNVIYKLQSVNGYDPLYLANYGNLIVASERGSAETKLPWGFNRIVVPKNVDSPLIDLLGVKYVLSLRDETSPKLVKVFQEGETRVYQNTKAFPRAFLTANVLPVANNRQAMDNLWKVDLAKTAVVEKSGMVFSGDLSGGMAGILSYRENSIQIRTQSSRQSFLVLTDSFYPGWKATVDGNPETIYLTDINFRGIFVPAGTHLVEFKI